MRGVSSSLGPILAIGLLAGSTMAVAGQEEAGPTVFTGRFAPSSQIQPGTNETVDDHTEARGHAWAPLIVEMSDPRLDGAMTYSSNVDRYTGPDGAWGELGVATYRIETEDGAWEGSAPFFSTSGVDFSPTTVVLVGQDAYEGLYAVMDADWDAVTGVIFPGPPPPVPTAP